MKWGKYKDMINDVYKDNFGESINDVAAIATVNQNMSYLDDSALAEVYGVCSIGYIWSRRGRKYRGG